MNMQGTGKFMKGMAAGLVVGAAVAMVADPLSDRQRHKLQKKQRVYSKMSAAL